jgi:hypothetical protein
MDLFNVENFKQVVRTNDMSVNKIRIATLYDEQEDIIRYGIMLSYKKQVVLLTDSKTHKVKTFEFVEDAFKYVEENMPKIKSIYQKLINGEL